MAAPVRSIVQAVADLVPAPRLVLYWEQPRVSPGYEQWWVEQLADLDRVCPGLHRTNVAGRRVAACSVDWHKAEAAAHVEAHKAARRGRAPDFEVLDHEVLPEYADPRWCWRCREEIVEAIAQLPDLAPALWARGHDAGDRFVDQGRPGPRLATVTPRVVTARVPLGPDPEDGSPRPQWSTWWREYLECHHDVTVRLSPDRGSWPVYRACPLCRFASTGAGEGRISAGGHTDGAGKGGTRVGSPSLSPAMDAVDELASWAGRTAALLKLAQGDAPGTTYDVAHADLSTSVAYLLARADQLLASDKALEVGRKVVRLVKDATTGAGLDELVHRLPARCPRCNRKGLQRHDGSEIVQCRACREMWSHDEYEWLVRTALDEAKA